MLPTGTLLLSRSDVARLLTLDECIGAVEAAFRARATGATLGAGVLGMPMPGGGFHIKAAGLGEPEPLFVTKINGNFFGNAERGLPRIQGVIALFDASHGYPLAVMDSTLITVLRTGAATAVAARYLARSDAGSVTVIGCGLQGRVQLRALCAVRRVTRVLAVDTDARLAQAYAREMSRELGVTVDVARELAPAARAGDMVITCTPSRQPVLFSGDVAPGTFIAAVGADSEEKQELAPGLMASAAVVPDILEQAATFGDLHHAIAAGVMTRDDVRGELGAVVAGCAPGRLNDDEIIIFDSTGTALQDVAAAAAVYRRAAAGGHGVRMDLVESVPGPVVSPRLERLACRL